ncbi:MAG: DotG/IcmE/VirB10 family protein [Micavibrio aeruginosavorus]|uniref:DotG/IcmE/VirB10 family protein n=1 Tax=Micavibrio aeruginosavorus TaxID=349221 RepID=A0A7T5R2U4_9BACT|nr:MAG: DotG/IcmE/VirB10 family protein [Micavibrio aeruginosavorus]
MTNNENDQEPEDFETGSEENDSFDEFEGVKGASPLNSPMVKVGIIVAGIAAIIAVITLFGGEKEQQQASRVKGAKEVSAPPGMEEVSPAMREAIEQTNEEAAEEAARTGGSAIPVPINTPDVKMGLPDAANQQQEDPLERWRRIQEERQKREALAQKPRGPEVDPNADVIDELAKAMAKQMETILEAQTPEAPQVYTVADADYLEEEREREAQKQQEKAAAAAAAAGTGQPPVVLDIIQPAGTIEYAQLITEANSDAPGPVLAQVMSGPLKGSRILGSFEVKERYLTLSFSTIVVDGVSYSAEAIALDPSSANPGIVTEIDQRYFSRIILPAAAAFVEGMGEAIAETGNTTVTVEGDTVAQEEEELDTREQIFKGVEEAASKASEIIDEEAGKVQRLIKVHAGTPVGILFLQPVTKDAAAQ